MSRIIRVIIQNSLYQNKNRTGGKKQRSGIFPISLFFTSSVYVLVRRIFNYYPNYPTHRLYFAEKNILSMARSRTYTIGSIQCQLRLQIKHISPNSVIERSECGTKLIMRVNCKSRINSRTTHPNQAMLDQDECRNQTLLHDFFLWNNFPLKLKSNGISIHPDWNLFFC